MTLTAPPPPIAVRAPMTSLRKTSLAAGVLYLLTFVSIPTLFLYGPVLTDPRWVTGPGPDTPVRVGGLLEIVVALAGVGTAVALYPVVKRQNHSLALGFVASRTMEAAAIVVGVASLLAMVTLRQAGGEADALVAGQALVAGDNWMFLLGQSLMPALNALLLGSLLYRSRLVPRILPLVGLIGAPVLLVSDVAVLLGLWERLSARPASSPSRSRSGSSPSASTSSSRASDRHTTSRPATRIPQWAAASSSRSDGGPWSQRLGFAGKGGVRARARSRYIACLIS